MPEMPVCAFGAEIVRVPDAPFRDCDKVMLLPPANSIRTCAPEAIPVVPDVFPRFDMPIDWLSADWVNALMVTVPPDTFVDCESVMLLPPASTSRVPVIPVSPDVLPMFDMPAEKPPPAPALMVIVSDTPLVDPDRVMLFPPAKTSRPATVPVSPLVLPPEIPAENCVPVCAATEMSTRCPVLELTVTPPPTPVIVNVPDVYVVFDAATPPRNVCVSG